MSWGGRRVSVGVDKGVDKGGLEGKFGFCTFWSFLVYVLDF